LKKGLGPRSLSLLGAERLTAVEIREGESVFEMINTALAGSSTRRDLRFTVRVSSAGFGGASADVWADVESVTRFLQQLQELELRRQGTARLDAISSPDELWLEIRSIDRSGHVALFGKLCHRQFLRPGADHSQQVQFGFEFCPSLLPRIIADLRRWVEATIT